MTLILSVDLACKAYHDFGFCLLQESAGKVVNIQYPSGQDIGLKGAPEPSVFAHAVLRYCLDNGVSILMLDGPQGWKAPENGLPHQRICEKVWNTMAKTGTRGQVKPANFQPFISFSIDVFSALYQSGVVSLVTRPEIEVPASGVLLIETYPHSAWRSLNIQPLSSKKKCTPKQMAQNLKELERRFQLPECGTPTHDQLSALAAGLAGVAIAAGKASGYVASGAPPRLTPEGYLVEGYIVNPG
jgi:hypothetical protein